jgi:hypothetical protein
MEELLSTNLKSYNPKELRINWKIPSNQNEKKKIVSITLHHFT